MNDKRYAPGGFLSTPIAWALLLGLANATHTYGQTKDTLMAEQHQTTDWKLERMISSPLKGETIAGKPEAINCPYGKAVQFNGQTDGLFLDENPLEGLSQFTVEIVFHPDLKGEFEQRFLHMGAVNSERVLLELRLTENNQWYLDAYMKSGESFQALIDKNLVHAAGEWSHVALVVDNGKMATYVNGKHELDGKIDFSPFKAGATSIGVRMNKRSWFKGAIYMVRITPKCLTPSEFVTP